MAIIRKHKTNGVLQKGSHTNQPFTSVKKQMLNKDPPEETIQRSIAAILNDNCSWAEVESHWDATKNYRLTEITNAKYTSDILDKWSQYKKPLGFKLIDMDLKHLYPNSDSLSVSLHLFLTKIIPVFEERIKDQTNRLLLQNMQKMANITENGQCLGIFYLLHSILGRNICTRFSIRDSQKSSIIDGSTVAACEEELLKRQQAKTQIEPSLLVSGSILEPKEIIVYFDGIKYKFDSAANAIDICFKIFFIFNVEYPKECILVWSFVQKYFYNITTNSDYASPLINSLIANLN